MLPQHKEETEAVRQHRRSDVALAILAAVATIGFAWTGFQSSAWLRHRFSEADKVSELNEEALAATSQADSTEERDIVLYVEWVGVLQAGAEETADAIFDLFREPVRDYVENADVTVDGVPAVPPFEDENYDVTRRRAAAGELAQAADRHADATDRASEMAARYGGIGVMFAAVLAASGVAARFDGPGIRRGFIIIGGILVVAATTLLLFIPVEFV